MSAVSVAVLGGEPALRLAGELGKGEVEGDVARHFFKTGGLSVNLFTPSRYPERVQGVSQSLLVADHVLLVADKVDRDLGLLILAAAASGVQRGHLLLGGGLDPSQIEPLVADTSLASWPVLTGRDVGPPLVRERIAELEPGGRPGKTRVVVEQAFPVRGVGTVVLGVVTQGEVKRHQALAHHPAGRSVTVRSIQVHDENMDSAGGGQRVGLALRGVEADTLSRGHVLCEEGAASTHPAGEPLRVELAVPRFHAPGMRAGRNYHMGTGLQFVPVEALGDDVPAGGSGPMRLVPSGPVVVAGGQRLLVWDLEHGPLRLVAGGSVADDEDAAIPGGP